MRISDWSSDVCSSDLVVRDGGAAVVDGNAGQRRAEQQVAARVQVLRLLHRGLQRAGDKGECLPGGQRVAGAGVAVGAGFQRVDQGVESGPGGERRSEEHTSELQSLMRNSYAAFCLKKNKTPNSQTTQQPSYSHYLTNQPQ